MGRWYWFILPSLIVKAAAAPWITVVSQSLLLPPTIRLGFVGGAQALRKDCEARSVEGCIWCCDSTQGYQVATALFQTLAAGRNCTTVWFPRFSDTEVLEGLKRAVNDNAIRLGGVTLQVLAWPRAPCNGMQVLWPVPSPRENLMVEPPTEASREASVSATETWVEGTLCRLGLCPYTASLLRAAVGLESSNVKDGPIVIRPPLYQVDASAASLLAAAFWEGVTEIATTSEQVVATLLLIAPSVYDGDFREFAAACDELIEVTLQVVKADQIVGRAWFHPNYDAASIGHDEIIAGHALPASMVQGFIATIMAGSFPEPPSLQFVAKANDAVRWTPHATINLLRRSQLVAAKQVEAASSNKKPNAVYARNVMKILADQNGNTQST